MDPFTTYVAAAIAKSNCLKAHSGIWNETGAPPRQSFAHCLFQVVDNEVPESCRDGFPNVPNIICNRHLVKPARALGGGVGALGMGEGANATDEVRCGPMLEEASMGEEAV